MPNTQVFTGADGALSLSTPQGTEGEAAQEVLNEYDLLSVGRVKDVRVEVRSDIKAFNEIGQRYATELRPGNITIRGTIGRAMINGAMLRLLLGEASTGRPSSSWVQPAFNLTVLVENPVLPGARNVIMLHDIKIDGWSYGLPEDDFVLESVGFQALYLTVTDES